MNIEMPAESRPLRTVRLKADLTIVGGGMAGVCSAITAARSGLKVVLVQDRPVLGGNASSEVRLWLLGATAHMGANNRWAREGGVINEIILENLWRNPEGNSLIFDTVLLDKVLEEKKITLLLNTACFEVSKDRMNGDRIASVKAFCSQNSTLYEMESPLYCDASGDGIVGFLSGAAFRVGAESREEFNEGFAPSGDFGQLLGHSIYFYSKDVGRPVKFIPPSFAFRDIEKKIPRYTQFSAQEHGCNLWWIEWGGRCDTVHESESIKMKLWEVVYGVWDYIKNSGKFPEAENLTLEWVGHIPGKRESRRFEGDYILRQQDIVERRHHADAVAFGGWSIDLHPADGVFAEISGSHHLHSKGIYQIPYRCYYSRNIENLFLAGRIISASHVAFGSTRVMCTCALGGQAIAEAAVICKKYNLLPRAVGNHMPELQARLFEGGQDVPAVPPHISGNLARTATITADSVFYLDELPPNGPRCALVKMVGQMIPLPAGKIPTFTFWAGVSEKTTVHVELRTTSDGWHHTPDVILETQSLEVTPGEKRELTVQFNVSLQNPAYVWVCFTENPVIELHTSLLRITGLLRVSRHRTEDCLKVGGERYEVFIPERRPGGHNLAFRAQPPIHPFSPENVQNGLLRPTYAPNAWVAAPDVVTPAIQLDWPSSQKIGLIQLFFDVDYDHALESVLFHQPERAVIFCVKHYQILDENGNILAEMDDHHQAQAMHRFATPIETKRLTIRILETWGAPAALFEVRCFSPDHQTAQ